MGVLLATLAQFSGALGKILMKKAHNLPVVQARITNLMAFACIILLNPVCGLAAYAYAAQSLLAPLSVLNLVWNAVLAWALLGELLRARGVFAYILICVGTLEAASHGVHAVQKFTFEELLELYAEPAFHVYAAAQLALLVGCVYVLLREESYASTVVEFAWGALAGTISGNQFLSKSVSVVISAVLEGKLQWCSLSLWAIVVGTIIVAVGGIVLLNKGLKRSRAITLIPIFQSFFVINNVVSGLVYFQEYMLFTPSMATHYAIAFAFIFAGIAINSAGMGSGKPTIKVVPGPVPLCAPPSPISGK
eukprot:g1462.t1